MPTYSPDNVLDAAPPAGSAPALPAESAQQRVYSPDNVLDAQPPEEKSGKPHVGGAGQVLAGAVKGMAGLASGIQKVGEFESGLAHIATAEAEKHLPWVAKHVGALPAADNMPDVGAELIKGANKVGIQTPEPQSLAEHVEQGVGAFLPYAFSGGEGWGQTALNALRTAVAGAASGAGEFGASQIGSAFGPTGQKIGSAIGSVAGALTPAAVEGGLGKLYQVVSLEMPPSEAARNRNVIARLTRAGVEPEVIAKTLDERAQPGGTFVSPTGGAPLSVSSAGEIVPGAQPTTAALTESPALGELEGIRETINPAAFQGRRAAQRGAQSTALAGIAPPEASAVAPATKAASDLAALSAQAEGRVRAATAARESAAEELPEEETSGQFGGQARDIVAGTRAAQAAKRNALYQELEEKNPNIPLPGIEADLDSLRSGFDRDGSLSIPVVAQQLKGLDDLGRWPLWSNVNGYLGRLNDALERSKYGYGQWTTETKKLSDIKAALTGAMQKAADSGSREAASVLSQPEANLLEDSKPFTEEASNAETGTIGYGGTGAQESAPGAALGVLPLSGGEHAQEGGLGGIEGTQNIPGDQILGPHWTEEDRALYSAAREAHARLKNVWDENGTIGKVLAKRGPMAFEQTEEKAADTLFPANQQLARQAAIDWKNAGGNREAYEQIASSSLRRKAMNSDGSLDRKAYQAWLANHGPALDEFPGLRTKFDTLDRAQSAVDDAVTARDNAVRSYQKGAARLLLGKDPEQTARGMFSIATPRADVEAIAKQMSRSPEAAEGLKRLAADYVLNNYVKQLATSSGNEYRASVDALTRFVRQNREKLALTLGPKGLESLDRIIADSQRNAAVYTRRSIVNSRTSRDIAGMERARQPLTWIGGMMRLITSAPGQLGSWLLGGVGGGIADAAAAHTFTRLQSASDGLMEDFLLHPNVARRVLEQVPKDRVAAEAYWRRTARLLAPTSGYASAQRGNRASGGRIEAWTPKDVERAAKETDHAATGLQKTADNYRKGRFKFAHGPLSKLGSIAIETGKGRTRIAHDGSWKVPNMPAHYGHLTSADGSDGDKADVFVGDDLSSRRVWVIDQINLKTGKFDETKSMLGFPSEEAARKAYIHSFSDGKGKKRIGSITEVPADVFVDLAKADKLKSPVGRKAFAGGGLAQDLQDIGGDLSSGLLNQGIVALANRYPAVDQWRMGLGQRVGELINDPVGFYKSAVEDVTPNPKGLMQTMAGLNTPEAQQAKKALMNIGLAGLTVYHGSPYSFDKFDASKIGTGEGAQAYGHGIYLAENPNVAQEYAQNLSDIDQLSPSGMAARALAKNNGDAIKAKQWLYSQYNEGQGRGSSAAFLKAVDALNSGGVKAPNFYKVDLPDEVADKMLDWDTPLSEQSTRVQNALEPFLRGKVSAPIDVGNGRTVRMYSLPGRNIGGAMTDAGGATLWNHLEAQYGKEGAARALSESGIHGIKYLDQGSRATGQGTHNFVLFPGNEHLAKIIGRNP